MKEYLDYVDKRQSRKLVLFGAGKNAVTLIYDYFVFDDVAFICDNDEKKHGKKMLGIPICSPDKLLDNPEDFVVIITPKVQSWIQQVSEQLASMNIPYVYDYCILSFVNKLDLYDSPWFNSFNKINPYLKICENSNKIQLVRSMLCDERSLAVYDSFVFKMKYSLGDYTDIRDQHSEEYFPDDVFSYTDKEVFVDGGSYNGADTIRYFKKLGSKFKKAYCFEPDDINYNNTCKNLTTVFGVCDNDIVKVFKSGLSNQNSSINFFGHGTVGSRFTEEPGKTSIVKLDDVVDEKDAVSLIKLDIEGHERFALEGMVKTIRRDKPKLAICIYHKLADLWELPLYIKELVPEYKFFVRHHSNVVWSKVLYATI